MNRYLMRHKVRQFPLVFIAAIILMITTLTLGVVFSDKAAAAQYEPSVAGARQFGRDFCPGLEDINGQKLPEYRIADLMWMTASDGSNNIDFVDDGRPQIVSVKVHFGVTYCAKWDRDVPTYAEDLGVKEERTSYDRLSGYNIKYGTGRPVENTSSGQRYFWDDSFNMQLNVSNWGSGTHIVCTEFATVSDQARRVEPSPSTCFPIDFTRIQPWSITGRSYTSVDSVNANQAGTITGEPGQTVRWRHTVTNNLQTNGNPSGSVPSNTIGYKVEGFGSDNMTARQYGPQLNRGASFSVTDYFNVNQKKYVDARYNITQADVGNTLCQYITSWPHSYNWQSSPPNWRRSTPACVNVPYDFNLTPMINPISQAIAEPGTNLGTITARVTKDGPTKSYNDTQWQLSRIVIGPSVSVPTANQGTQLPCVYYGNECEEEVSGTSTFTASSTVVEQLTNVELGDLEAGSQLCFALSVKRYEDGLSASAPNWRYSTPECVKVGKKPKVQVWGGDVRAESVDTSISTKQVDSSDRTFGSWVEYGVFTQGSAHIASGAGLAGTDGSDTDCASSWNKLTFANQEGDCAGNDFGLYAQSSNVASMTSALLGKFNIDTARDLPGTVNVAEVVSDNAAVRRTGGLTLNGGTVEPGKWGVLYATGTVRITGNIDYSDASLSSPSDIPQLVIIAPNIEIMPEVTNVDAWLVAAQVNATTGDVAGGMINTCYRSGSQALTVSLCEQQLTITGPVLAEELLLRRTAGSGVAEASNDPAEIINLRADAYLWAMSQTQGSQRAQTVYTKDLAPRF